MRALRDRRLAWAAAAVVAGGLFLAVVPGDPPGFYQDEAALSYNAYTIEQTGRDEYGAVTPLFFRSFDDYKSPVYPYLLAGVFRVAGPGIEAARVLSAVLGLLAVLGLGLVAARATGRPEVGAAAAFLAALTPWLFEVTRLVFEVSILPLAIVLLLLALWRARARCDWGDALAVGISLGLVTYAYAAGRVLGPLFALGLVLFWRGWRWRGVARCWAVYTATLAPLAGFALRHSGALSARFGATSYFNRHTPVLQLAHDFVVDYLRDVDPWGWVVHGDPNARHHVHGLGGSLLLTVVLLAVGGLVYGALRRRDDPWWRFLAFGLVVAPVPGAITLDRMHSLRMVAFPVFLLLFAALALEGLLAAGGRAGRLAVVGALLVAAVQGALFQWQFRANGPDRVDAFEATYPQVLAIALGRPGPVYVFQDDPTYANGLWYGLLDGASGRIVRLPSGEAPPPGATVVAAGVACQTCTTLASSSAFVAYVSP